MAPRWSRRRRSRSRPLRLRLNLRHPIKRMMMQQGARSTSDSTSMNASPAKLPPFIDAAADRIARAIATLQHEGRREREVREAEHRARMAELEARLASVG